MRVSVQNAYVRVAVDDRGRIVSLFNRKTGTELIAHPKAAEAWRIVVPTGRHTVAFLQGSQQAHPRVQRVRDRGSRRIILSYPSLKMGRERLAARARFVLSLPDDSAQIAAHVEIDNRSAFAVDEVEFPIIGGLGGFGRRGGARTMELVVGQEQGAFYGDVLNRGLPAAGRASNHFCRENETAMFEAQDAAAPRQWWVGRGLWLDLWCARQGLYAALQEHPAQAFAWKMEKYPKEVPNGPAHAYPRGTPRWLRLHGLHMPRVQPGAKWRSQSTVIMPHAGDWHVGADVYGAWRRKDLKPCKPPVWMNDFVGWTEILGKTYLGEVFHDYAQCADAVVKDAKVTGLNFLFYYGHTAIGAEGADYDYGPAEDMGGEEGWRAMVDKLHRSGVRIMLLDHAHRWVNRDLPEYERLGLERWAVRTQDGALQTARWWKETGLSCLRLEGPTPEWVDMCPSCAAWREHYRDHVTSMIELGADGLELDTWFPSACYNPDHDHEPGEHMLATKLEWMREVRAHAKALNPDFVLFAETMLPEAREVMDGYYPSRYLDENGRIYRYLFPELREQAALVGNYAYDQVNKALSLGIGVETEIWGLRRTALAACPQLARYIGEVNRLRRRHADILIGGVFRDTLGASVKGDVLYSVLEGAAGGKALVLRNPHERAQKVTARLKGIAKSRRLIVWRPFGKERRVRSVPLTVTVRPREAVVLLAL